MRLIDILNKIANGELKEGTKVICNNSTFEYRKLHKDSGRNTLDLYSKNNTSLINATYLTPVLSFEVELIEPEEPIFDLLLNLNQVSNDDILKELQHQDNEYLNKIIDNQLKIIEQNDKILVNQDRILARLGSD